jgi:hypothetical protein
MPRDPSTYLYDIREAALKLQRFTAGKLYAD